MAELALQLVHVGAPTGMDLAMAICDRCALNLDVVPDAMSCRDVEYSDMITHLRQTECDCTCGRAYTKLRGYYGGPQTPGLREVGAYTCNAEPMCLGHRYIVSREEDGTLKMRCPKCARETTEPPSILYSVAG